MKTTAVKKGDKYVINGTKGTRRESPSDTCH